MRQEKKLETRTQSTMRFVEKAGWKPMQTPRWESIKASSDYILNLYRYCKKRQLRMKRAHIYMAILHQPFSGVRGEWVEQHYGTWGNPHEGVIKNRCEPCASSTAI